MGLGIEDFDEEVILGDMQAVLLIALHGDTRPHDLGQTVNVINLIAELVLEVLAELVRERLGAMDAGLEREVLLGVKAHLDGGIGDVHGIARCAAQDGRAHGLQDLDLALRVAGRHRDGLRTHGKAAVMRTQATGEQAVAVADVHDVIDIAVGIADAAAEAVTQDLMSLSV